MEDRDKDAVELINEAQDVVDKEDGDSEYSGRLLHQAAIYDNSELTQSLLEGVEREHVDAQDSFGRTALYTAVTNNSFECANLLLQAGGNPSLACGPQCGCMTPLHAAALDNKHSFISLLIDYGANTDLKDTDGNTPYVLAEKNKNEGCCILLVERIARRQRQRNELDKEFEEVVIEGDVMKAKKIAEKISEAHLKAFINNIPKGQNSLLFRACENGYLDMVEFLLTKGAVVQVHPVTGYSPLHAACHTGNVQCAQAILQHFPELIGAPTIDGTFPLHMACAEGKVGIVKLLLNFRYPELVRKLSKESTGNRMYRLGVPINSKDGHGRTPLHVATINNRAEVVKLLLRFRVIVVLRYQDSLEEEEGLEDDTQTVGRASDADGRMNTGQVNEEINPVEVDVLDLDGSTPLHVAVKGNSTVGYLRIASLLLQHKANPNKPFITPTGNCTPLMESCRMGNVDMMALLLRYGARDDNFQVLRVALRERNWDMVGAIIQHKSHMDPEYKVNIVALLQLYEDAGYDRQDFMTASCMSGSMMTSSKCFRSLWPSHAVVINWHSLSLPQIEVDWLYKACWQHTLKPPPDVDIKITLASITRLDVSNNHLLTLPPEVFQMPSLKTLNASNNAIELLVFEDEVTTPVTDAGYEVVLKDPSVSILTNVKPVFSRSVKPSKSAWVCSVLEEVDIHSNKLQTIPADVFKLLHLVRANFSDNCLDSLPFEMWSAPKLIELNLSRNNLSTLPMNQYGGIDGVPVPRDRTHVLDLSVASSYGSPGNSESGTPHRGMSINTSASESLHLSRQSLPNPPSSLSLHNPGITQSYPDSPDAVQCLTPPYQVLPVTYLNQWTDKIRIHSSLGQDTKSTSSDIQSQLTELNLAHNNFSTIPQGLACVALHLDKMNLSHNKLSQIGPLENYPAGIKWLDLSHNDIMSERMSDCEEEMYSYSSLSVKTCYNPQIQSRQFRSMNRTTSASSASSGRRSRSPLPGSSMSTTGAAIYCPHRFHRQLDKLKTLRLSQNKLTKLIVTVQETDVELQSLDSNNVSTNSSHSGRKDGLADGGSIEEGREILYPALTLLDISYNCLTSLTPDIRLLNQLSELKVAGNRLRELPSEMGLLKKLWNLDLSGCPAEKSLQALLGEKAKKTAAVLSYLKSVKEEAMLYNRMKLMFVGIQGIGKTSLLSQLRREGRTFSQRNKNWAQRMGSSAIKDKDLKGENISTVGVDIGDLVLQKASREIIFSTWDFGGQREYYATHQYFLSKRSLYLVLWKLTDGVKGVHQILQWLVNIQARAPNSPVIIVGTHLDMITKKKYPPCYLPELQRLLVDKYMNYTEPEKSGLPRVVGHIEISCKSSFLFNNHVSDLVNIIWEAACEEQLPGNRGAKLLEQKVPATYVHLQEVIGKLAEDRKREGKDPVLHAEQYKPLVIQKMEEMYSTSFRDVTELSQATQFLHENGILLHYDDVNLQDIYFLDPQWLCDVLASVVTIREINSLAKSGIMRTADLKILFKNAAFKPEDIKTYIIDLLSKFEVALRWDEQNLLIPSLLPSEMAMLHRLPGTDVRIPMQKPPSLVHQSSSTSPKRDILPTATRPASVMLHEQNPQTFTKKISSQPPRSKSLQLIPNDLSHFPRRGQKVVGSACNQSVISSHPNPAVAIVRLYLMSYFPSGFWPRLITRLLGDDSMYKIAASLYDFAALAGNCDNFRGVLDRAEPQWKCWQSGVELIYMGVTLLRLREVSREGVNIFCDYRQCSMVIKQDHDMEWHTLDLQNMSILEMIILNETVSIYCNKTDRCMSADTDAAKTAANITDQLKTFDIQPSPQIVALMLAKLVDHIDTLLEDWYPDLGTRFIQNARGMYLITRIVPCTRCLLRQIEIQSQELASTDSWSMIDVHQTEEKTQVKTESRVTSVSPGQISRSRTVTSPGGSGATMFLDGVGGTAVLHQEPSPTKDSHQVTKQKPAAARYNTVCEPKRPSQYGSSKSNIIYCYLAEQCLQAAQMNKIVYCIEHANLGPYFIASSTGRIMAAHVAPDSVFQDIGDKYLVTEDSITRGRFLGRGAFGAVYAGVMIDKVDCSKIPVALKMLQPVKPDPDYSTASLLAMYQVERQRWNKDPMKSTCEAYLNARKELSILLVLNHAHIVPLLGITLHPLSLILSLAPLGALNEQLKEYVRAGARLPAWAVAQIIKQVASALDYLHSCQIIYRDLKSENVLVWSLPPPHTGNNCCTVLVKLADYGVSRCIIQSGTKGLAGTPPFIAPEIIQHNGEETYTEKVDIFSFGMFLYELLVLKLPFEGEGSAAVGGANMKGHILSGGRPLLTDKDLHYPTHFLDLMIMCWSHDPGERPTANQIVCLSDRPEFSHLYNVIPFDEGVEVLCGCSTPYQQSLSPFLSPQEEYMTFENSSNERSDVWIATRSHEYMEGTLLVLTYQGHQCLQAKKISLGATMICCLCVTEDCIWAADSAAVIHVFRLGDYTPILKFPATTRPNVQVTCMAYGVIECQVYVVLDNGRFILCEVDFPMDFSINYSPVKTECPGNGRPINCISALVTESRSTELWCGQSSGRLSVWNLHSTQGSMRRLCHDNNDMPGHDVTLLTVCDGDVDAVWTYVRPGTLVYRWNAVSKMKEATLDICLVFQEDDSNNGRTSAVNDCRRLQVTALTVQHDFLYVGTSSGTIVVADKHLMLTLNTISHHGSQPTIVKALIPLLVTEEDLEQDISVETDTDSGSIEVKPVQTRRDDGFILSVNVGYNDLMNMCGKPRKHDRDLNAMYLMCWASCNWQ